MFWAGVPGSQEWNAPEVYVTLDSDRIYELETTCVHDLLGLRARWPGAAVVKVMPDRDNRSVRVLVPEVKVRDQGFHNVTLLDMGDVEGPDVSVAYLSIMRLQWPLPVVSGMARRQLGLHATCVQEALLWNPCKPVYLLWEAN